MSSLAEPDLSQSTASPGTGTPVEFCPDSAPLQFLQQLLADQMRRWHTDAPFSVEHYLGQLISPNTHINWALELAAGEFAASRAAGKPVTVTALCQRFPQLASQLPGKLYPETQHSDEPRYSCRTLSSEDQLGTVWNGKDRQSQSPVSIRYFTGLPEVQLQLLQHRFQTLERLPHPQILPVLDCCRQSDGTLKVVTPAVQGIPLSEQLILRRPSVRDAAQMLHSLATILNHLHTHGLVLLALSPASVIIEPDSAKLLLNCTTALPQTDYLSPEQARAEDHRIDYRSDLFTLGIIFYEMLTGTRPFQGHTPADVRLQIASASVVPPQDLQPAIPSVLSQLCCNMLHSRVSDRCLSAADVAGLLQTWLHSSPQSGSAVEFIPAPTGLAPFDDTATANYPLLLSGPRNQDGLPLQISRWKSLIENLAADQTFSVAVFSGAPGTGKTSFLQAGLLPRLDPDILIMRIDAAHAQLESRLTALLQLHTPYHEFTRDTGEELPTLLRNIRLAPGRKVLIVIDHFEHWLLSRKNVADTTLTLALKQCDGQKLQTLLVIDDRAMQAAARLMAALEIPLTQNLNYATFDQLDVSAATAALTAFGKATGRLPPNGQLTAAQRQFIELGLLAIQQGLFVPQWQLALLMQFSRHLNWHPDSLTSLKPGAELVHQLLDQTFREIQQRIPDPAASLTAQRLLEALLPGDTAETLRPLRSQTELVQFAGTDVAAETVDTLLHLLKSQLSLLHCIPGFPARPPAPHAVLSTELKDTENSEPTDSPSTTPTADQISAEETAAADSTATPESIATAEPVAVDISIQQQAAETTALPNTEFAATPDSSPDFRTAEIPDVAWQLSHDFLVAPLGHWLSEHKRNSRLGRAEVTLKNCLSHWTTSHTANKLPSLYQWLQIAAHTDRRRWTSTERQLVQAAEKRHVRRILLLMILCLAVLVTASQTLRRFRASELAHSIALAQPEHLLPLLQKADRVGEFIDQYLQIHIPADPQANDSAAERKAALAAQLALLPRHPEYALPVGQTFLSADISTASVIRERLLTVSPKTAEIWKDTLLNPAKSDRRRFRAALGLAGLKTQPEPSLWTPDILRFTALQLTQTFAEQQPRLRSLLQPVAPLLVPYLQELCTATTVSELQRTSAAAAIAQFSPGTPQLLTDLLLEASPAQAELLVPPFAALKHQPSIERLQQLPASLPPREGYPAFPWSEGLRNANSALTLMAADLHAEAAAPLRLTENADVVSLFATLAPQWHVSANDLILGFEFNERLRTQPGGNQSAPLAEQATCSILLALSNWPFVQMPTSVQDSLPPYLQSLYQNDPSAAIHSLSGWLLEKWGFGNLRDAADETDVPYDPRSNRQWFRLSLPLTDNSGRKSGNQPTDKLRLTFIVIPAGDYTIGTPPRTITVTAPFAVCDRELPQSVWVRCQKQARPEPLDKPDPSHQQTASASDPAASSLSWIDAAVICRWLTQKHRGTSESWQCFSQTMTTDIRADRLGFRMPTSDEWDIVCSRKGAKAFASGSNPQLLNFYSWFTPDATAPQPPARKPPTPNGLFDCHGNVSEWTLDASQPGFRIHRGSSWDSTPLLSMLNTSYSSPENTAATNVGLRLACTLPDNNRRPNSRK